MMLRGGRGKEPEPESQVRTSGRTSEAQTEPRRQVSGQEVQKEPHHFWKAGILAAGAQHCWAPRQGHTQATGRKSFSALKNQCILALPTFLPLTSRPRGKPREEFL